MRRQQRSPAHRWDAQEREREAKRLFLASGSLTNMLLASEIDRIEEVVRARFPDMKFIDLEPM